MVNVVQNNLVIVGEDLFWKGKKVVGVQNINYRKSPTKTRISVIVKNTDPSVVAELRNAGIYVRREV